MLLIIRPIVIVTITTTIKFSTVKEKILQTYQVLMITLLYVFTNLKLRIN